MNFLSSILTKIKRPLIYGFAFALISSSLFFACDNQSDIVTGKFSEQPKFDVVTNKIDSLFRIDQHAAMNFVSSLLQCDTVRTNRLLNYKLIEKKATMKLFSGDTDSSLLLFTTALTIWESDTDAIGNENHSLLLFRIGSVYADKGETDNAILFFEQADSIATIFGISYLSIHSNVQLSGIYQSIGDYGRALECLEKSITQCHANSESALM
jgi:tetratricopeptide (TPR) repeat protein